MNHGKQVQLHPAHPGVADTRHRPAVAPSVAVPAIVARPAQLSPPFTGVADPWHRAPITSSPAFFAKSSGSAKLGASDAGLADPWHSLAFPPRVTFPPDTDLSNRLRT